MFKGAMILALLVVLISSTAVYAGVITTEDLLFPPQPGKAVYNNGVLENNLMKIQLRMDNDGNGHTDEDEYEECRWWEVWEWFDEDGICSKDAYDLIIDKKTGNVVGKWSMFKLQRLTGNHWKSLMILEHSLEDCSSEETACVKRIMRFNENTYMNVTYELKDDDTKVKLTIDIKSGIPNKEYRLKYRLISDDKITYIPEKSTGFNKFFYDWNDITEQETSYELFDEGHILEQTTYIGKIDKDETITIDPSISTDFGVDSVDGNIIETYGSNTYVILKNTTDSSLNMFKSTDGGATWNNEDKTDELVPATDFGLTMTRIGSKLYIMNEYNYGYVYREYNLLTDTFGTARETGKIISASPNLHGLYASPLRYIQNAFGSTDTICWASIIRGDDSRTAFCMYENSGSDFGFDISSQINTTGLTGTLYKGIVGNSTHLFVADDGTDSIYVFYKDLTTFNYEKEKDFSSQLTKVLRGVFIDSSGTRLYLAGWDNFIYQYTLGTAWDINTATYIRSFDFNPYVKSTVNVFFKPDGTKMYITNILTRGITEFDLGTAWNIGTASFVSYKQESLYCPYTIFFKPDGTKMYVSMTTDGRIKEYPLSTPWSISTAGTATTHTLTEDTNIKGLWFKQDGTKMYVSGNDNDKIYEYTLSTPWDIGTRTYSDFLDTTSNTTNPVGIIINDFGDKLYFADPDSYTLFQYTGIGSIDISSQDTQPKGLATDGTYFYMVGDYYNRVYKYDSDWNYIAYFGTGSQTTAPQGLTYDGTYFYVLSASGVVYQYTNSFPNGAGTYTGNSYTMHTANGRGLDYENGVFFAMTDGVYDSLYRHDMSVYKSNDNMAGLSTAPWGAWLDDDYLYITGSNTNIFRVPRETYTSYFGYMTEGNAQTYTSATDSAFAFNVFQRADDSWSGMLCSDTTANTGCRQYNIENMTTISTGGLGSRFSNGFSMERLSDGNLVLAGIRTTNYNLYYRIYDRLTNSWSAEKVYNPAGNLDYIFRNSLKQTPDGMCHIFGKRGTNSVWIHADECAFEDITEEPLFIQSYIDGNLPASYNTFYIKHGQYNDNKVRFVYPGSVVYDEFPQSGGLFIEAYDEETSNKLSSWNLNIYNSTNSDSQSGINSYYDNWLGYTTIKIDKSGFYTRYYYLNLTEENTPYYLDARLLNLTEGQIVTFLVLNRFGSPLQNTEISAYRNIEGTWTLVEQKTTDVSGTGSLFLNPDIPYLITAEKEGYKPFSNTLTPTSTSYTITLYEDISGIISKTYFKSITLWVLRPVKELFFVDETIEFSMNVKANKDTFEWFAMRLTLDNSTEIYLGNSTAPRGGYLSYNYVPDRPMKIYAEYMFQRNDINTTYISPKTVYVTADFSGNYTVDKIISDIKEKNLEGISNETKNFILSFFAIMIGVVIGLLLSKFGSLRAGVGVYLWYIAATYLDLISVESMTIITIFVVLIGLIYLTSLRR
mgnify:CR=1 FL=1